MTLLATLALLLPVVPMDFSDPAKFNYPSVTLHLPRALHRRHKRKPPPPMHTALASWYDDSGTTASGVHYTYGYASLMFGSNWGTAVQFCYRSCVTGKMDDHGPYVSGRAFDLNYTLHNAIGCSDLCTVRWRQVK